VIGTISRPTIRKHHDPLAGSANAHLHQIRRMPLLHVAGCFVCHRLSIAEAAINAVDHQVEAFVWLEDAGFHARAF
jgi:hypothetical protein